MGFSILNSAGQIKATADTILGQPGPPGEDGLSSDDTILASIPHTLLDGSIHKDTARIIPAIGDLILCIATGIWNRLAVGANGKVLIVAAGAPSWSDITIANATDYAATSWTVSDGSGAGLSITNNSAQYTQLGRAITITCDITYPVTVDASNAKLTGLPFTPGTAAGGMAVVFSNIGTGLTAYIRASTNVIELYNLGGGFYTNAQLSNKTITLAGVYFK